MTTQEIATAIEAIRFTKNSYGESYNTFGIRTDDKEYSIMDSVDNSWHEIDDNECDDEAEELDGCCATDIGNLWFDGEQEDLDTIEKAIKCNGTYKGAHQYIVAGTGSEYGWDDNEIIISQPVVIAIIR